MHRFFVILGVAAGSLLAQTPPAQAGRGGRGGGGGGFANAYPQRAPADPAVVERGKAIYGVNCAFCHGPDARGGSEGGPNLIRSQILLDDKSGELIAPVVLNGRGSMPKFQLTQAQISDVAAFIHSFRVGGYDVARNRPASIVVGDAKTGETTFKSKCGSCHSVTGDLKGIASKVTDPRGLQQHWLMPGGGGRGGRGGPAPPATVSPVTVTVSPASGPKVTGRLVRIDDFLVVLSDAEGLARSFRRDGDVPKVEIHDPLKPHKDLLRTYTDKEIHDITAFLVTVK